jgi:hypothetical protein
VAPPQSQLGTKPLGWAGGLQDHFATVEDPLKEEKACADLGVEHGVAALLARDCGDEMGPTQRSRYREPNHQELPEAAASSSHHRSALDHHPASTAGLVGKDIAQDSRGAEAAL